MLQLYFKRSKIFIDTVEGRELRFAASAQPSATPTPNWVLRTDTYKNGVKDGSIVNLTPPDEELSAETEEKEIEETVAATKQKRVSGAKQPAGLVTPSVVKQDN